MTVKRNFIKGVFFGIGGMGIRTVLNILIMPLIIQYLGVEQYGFYIFLLGFIDMLIMIDLGLNTGLVNRLSIYVNQGNQEKVKEQLCIGFWLYLGLAILMYVVGSFFLPYMTTWFHLSKPLVGIANSSYLIVLITGAFSLFGNYYQSLSLSHHRYHWVQLADLFYLVGSNILAVILLFMGYGLVEILLARLGLLLIRTVYLAYCTWKVEPFALFPPLTFNFQALKELFSVSAFSLMLGISGIFAMRIDNMVIAAHLTMVDVAIFGIVFRLYNMVSEVVDKITLGIMPLMSKFFSEGNLDATRMVFTRSTAFINFVTLSLLIWVTAYYEPIFGYFSHHEIPIEQTWNLIWIVIVIVWSRCIVRPAANYLFVFNHRWLVISASIASTLLNVWLSLALVKPLGMMGVALGTLIPMLLEHHLALIWQSCHKLEINALSFIKESYLTMLPALLVCAGIIFGLQQLPWGLGNAYLDMFFIGMLAFGLSGIVWLYTGTTATERVMINNRLLGVREKFGVFAPVKKNPIESSSL